ncbi:MAG: hypothetical protein HY720_16335 [Planctomycetes bacterium]|nr:hypothetical protein [Planctomycetota bacterium]
MILAESEFDCVKIAIFLVLIAGYWVVKALSGRAKSPVIRKDAGPRPAAPARRPGGRPLTWEDVERQRVARAPTRPAAAPQRRVEPPVLTPIFDEEGEGPKRRLVSFDEDTPDEPPMEVEVAGRRAVAEQVRQDIEEHLEEHLHERPAPEPSALEKKKRKARPAPPAPVRAVAALARIESELAPLARAFVYREVLGPPFGFRRRRPVRPWLQGC